MRVFLHHRRYDDPGHVAGRSALSLCASLSSSPSSFSLPFVLVSSCTCCVLGTFANPSIFWPSSIPFSSATLAIRRSTWSCGVEEATVDPMTPSIVDVWTSRSSNWVSNLSMTREIFRAGSREDRSDKVGAWFVI